MPDKKYDAMSRVWFKKINGKWCIRDGAGMWAEVTTADIDDYIYPASNLPNGFARVSFEFPLETDLGTFRTQLQIRTRYGSIEYAGIAFSDEIAFKDYMPVEEFWLMEPL